MKYFWKCLNCGYENHGKPVSVDKKTGLYHDKQDPKKCPMCQEKAFKVVEI